MKARIGENGTIERIAFDQFPTDKLKEALRAADVVGGGAALPVARADPRRLDARLEGRLQHRVARDLGEVARRAAPHLP